MTNPIDKAQPEALRLAAWLNEGCWHHIRLGDVEAAGRELRRLHAEVEALRADAARLDFIEKAVLRHDLCKWGAYGYTFSPRLPTYDPIIQVCVPSIRDLVDAAIKARAAASIGAAGGGGEHA